MNCQDQRSKTTKPKQSSLDYLGFMLQSLFT